MITHPSPNRLPEPPPAVLPAHDFRFDLLDGERAVGWIGPDAIGFAGFASETEAAHAAWVAFRTLSRRIARREGHRPMPIDSEPLRLEPTAHGIDVVASFGRIANVIRSPFDGDHSVGFELRLDPPRDELTVRSKAHLIYRTLRRAGVKWGMWSNPADSAARSFAPAAAPVTSPDSPDMTIDDPLGARDIVVSALLLMVAVLIVLAPGAFATILALGALGGLVMLRLTLLHRGWPPRASLRQEGRAPHGHATARYGTYNAARSA